MYEHYVKDMTSFDQGHQLGTPTLGFKEILPTIYRSKKLALINTIYNKELLIKSNLG